MPSSCLLGTVGQDDGFCGRSVVGVGRVHGQFVALEGAGLGVGAVADVAIEGLQTCVLAVMGDEVGALVEDFVAALEFAAE